MTLPVVKCILLMLFSNDDYVYECTINPLAANKEAPATMGVSAVAK